MGMFLTAIGWLNDSGGFLEEPSHDCYFAEAGGDSPEVGGTIVDDVEAEKTEAAG